MTILLESFLLVLFLGFILAIKDFLAGCFKFGSNSITVCCFYCNQNSKIPINQNTKQPAKFSLVEDDDSKSKKVGNNREAWLAMKRAKQQEKSAEVSSEKHNLFNQQGELVHWFCINCDSVNYVDHVT